MYWSKCIAIQFNTRFVLAEVSRWPLPCTGNCQGGGTMVFDLGALEVGEYEVRMGEAILGNLVVTSGVSQPRQCLAR